MMVSRFIRNGDYDKAQEILDLMPDKEDAASSMADKQILQINIYLRQGETEKKSPRRGKNQKKWRYEECISPWKKKT